MRAANRLVLDVGIEIDLAFVWLVDIDWICRCGGSNLTGFQLRDRKWFILCMGVENDLVLASRLKLTWICVMIDRKLIVLTGRCVCYVVKDH